MSLFNFRGQAIGNYFDAYNRPSTKGLASVRRFPANQVTAQISTNYSNSGGTYNINRMNPVWDRLDQGSIIEDWIGKDASSIDKMYNLIYLRDGIAGPTVDLMSRLPWSDFVLTGIEDEKVLQIYQDACTNLNLVPQLPIITAGYLTLGKVIASLLFSEETSNFTGMIAHDPDMVKLEPRPIFGFDPKIDLRASPAMQKFVRSQDDRDVDAKKTIPPGMLSQLMTTGYIPLEPANTLYLARRVMLYDFLGTSFLTRVVPYWALEKALITGTVINARRRTRDLYHITAGIDNTWEPTSQEMEFLTMLVTQADEDPNGGAIATRTGVEIQTLGNTANIWKVSDEADFLSNGKMRALGVNDAFLSGETTYNTLEMTLSVFIESLRCLRDEITAAIFYNKIFKTLAEVHEFYDKSPAEVAHRINVKRKGKDRKLIIPKIMWNKQLRPEADSTYFDILNSAESKGVPIGLKTYAVAAGVDLESEMANIEEDMKLRQKIADLKGESPEAEASILDNAVLGGFRPMVITAVTARKDPEKALKMLPFWDKQGKFLQLDFNEAAKTLAEITKRKAWLRGNGAVKDCAKANLDGNERKAQLMQYIVARCGFGYAKGLDKQTVRDISEHILRNHKNGNLQMEIRAVRKLTGIEGAAPESEFTALDKVLADKNVTVGSGKILLTDPIPRNSTQLLSGIPVHSKDAKNG